MHIYTGRSSKRLEKSGVSAGDKGLEVLKYYKPGHRGTCWLNVSIDTGKKSILTNMSFSNCIQVPVGISKIDSSQCQLCIVLDFYPTLPYK